MATERRARRTRAQVESAINAAVFAELAEVGYSRLTFEGVARRADMSKHVLYRRHATRPALVIAALRSVARTFFADEPTTGTLRGDLLTWLAVARSEFVGADTFRGLVGEARSEELAQVEQLLELRAQDVRRAIFAPALRRGELMTIPPDSVAKLFFVLVRDRVLFGAPSDDSDWIVDEVLLPLLAVSRLADMGSPQRSAPRGADQPTTA